MRVIICLLLLFLSACSGPMITVRTIADCPSYRDQQAPEAVKQWLAGQYPDGKPVAGVPDELGPWLKRVADNTEALNQACATK